MTHGTTSQSRAIDVDALGGTDIASTSGPFRDVSSPGRMLDAFGQVSQDTIR
jgi:hypothetical protein